MKEAAEITFPMFTSHRHLDGATGQVTFTRTKEWVTIQLECPECNGTEFRQMYCGSSTYDEFVDTDRELPWKERRSETSPEYVEGSFEPNDDGWWCLGCNSTVEAVLAYGLDWYRDLTLMPVEAARKDMLTNMVREGQERAMELRKLAGGLRALEERIDE